MFIIREKKKTAYSEYKKKKVLMLLNYEQIKHQNIHFYESTTSTLIFVIKRLCILH